MTERRLFTIREAHDDGDIDTVGEFQAYTTLAQAKKAVKALVERSAKMNAQAREQRQFQDKQSSILSPGFISFRDAGDVHGDYEADSPGKLRLR